MTRQRYQFQNNKGNTSPQFGDGGNDIEMLQWAGTGVAMGNAGSHVQDAADHVTTTVEAGGIAAFLEPVLAPYL